MSALHLNVISPNQYCLNIKQYVKNKVWERVYCKLFLSAVEQVVKLTKKDLDEKWKLHHY
jgi:hypothetical protein